MTTTTIGYLFPNPRHGGVSLAVPCDACQAFHWHGAGTLEHPIERPSTVTHRVSHCHNGNDYDTIEISAEPYRPQWVTSRRGRFSAAYRRHLEAAA